MRLLERRECLEELGVMAIVQALYQLAQDRHLLEDLNDFRCSDDLRGLVSA